MSHSIHNSVNNPYLQQRIIQEQSKMIETLKKKSDIQDNLTAVQTELIDRLQKENQELTKQNEKLLKTIDEMEKNYTNAIENVRKQLEEMGCNLMDE